jgi:hypothetical protein
MKKTIPLTHNPRLISRSVSKWLFILVGIGNTINGIDKLMEGSLSTWILFLSIFLLLTGLLMLTLGIILFNPKSRFAPKVEVDDEQIIIREDVFNRTKSIRWREIKQIDFKSYALAFLYQDGTSQQVLLKTTKETSVEIKRSLRDMAYQKLITIRG